ncbi:MAG: type III-B CRISPR module RAMP protein Cmr6 [Halanaerobiales bacterium]|nr:type III-B CRISPR module RAMP protein Cmr6 [Halanaerobiales bacterium]
MGKDYTGNLGFLFYKHYYRDDDLRSLIELDNKGMVDVKASDAKGLIKDKNKMMYDYIFPESSTKSRLEKSIQKFSLKTIYPGLVIGTGITHEVGLNEEFKIGFQFDYLTGLPIIPGSSVKGMLRSAFPNDYPDDKKKKSDRDQQRADERREYIKYLLSKVITSESQLNSICIDDLEYEIFDGIKKGESIKMKERDIFFAAEIVKGNKKGKILGEDYITPHPGPLLAPTPLRFLKVLPNVTFEFRFDLKGGILTSIEKIELFKRIILDLGIGAKTNVGYGALIECGEG